MGEKMNIIEELQKQTENIKVPKTLEPENIMGMIQEKNQRKEQRNVIRMQKRATRVLSMVAAACFVLLAVNTVVLIRQNSGNPSDTVASGTIGNADTEAIKESDDSQMAKNYEDIYKSIRSYIREHYSYTYKDSMYFGVANELETAVATATDSDMAVSESIQKNESFSNAGSEDESDFSKTNVMTQGIDEADCIKTDGSYIYYLNADTRKVLIYEAKGQDSKLLRELAVSGIGSPDDMMVDGNSLYITGTTYRGSDYQFGIVKYDISDRNNPKKTGEFFQEGYKVEVRKIGNVVYFVTNKSVERDEVKKNDPKTYVPMVANELVECEDIVLSKEIKRLEYMVITSIDTETMNKIDALAVFGMDGEFYMGENGIYLYEQQYKKGTYTVIRKIAYQDGELTLGNEGKVPGEVRDTFAVNEYKGYFRIITTSRNQKSSTVNNVFILDEKMDVVGSVEGLAEGERVYAARYLGDVVYFVTFRETDPLFSVDLSDPTSPCVMGALKIPGFSEYLHPYGEGKLLGIGMGELQNSWDRVLKLSMFDITNPYDVTEQSVTLLKDASSSPALYQYKAVMIDPKKNIFGFATENYQTGGVDYLVYTYEDNTFRELIRHHLEKWDNMEQIRSVYVGDDVYILSGDLFFVESISGQ